MIDFRSEPCKHMKHDLRTRPNPSKSKAELFEIFYKLIGRFKRESRSVLSSYSNYLPHLIDCIECRNWLDSEMKDKDLVAEKKRASYCCLSLYRDIEEDGGFVKYTRNRENTFYWYIGNDSSIHYCPWCGSGLPNEHY